MKKYVRERKAQMRASEGACIELVWAPGEAQADFGDVEVVYRSERVRMHFFALSFPFSNMGFCQLFAGETVLRNIESDIWGVLTFFRLKNLCREPQRSPITNGAHTA